MVYVRTNRIMLGATLVGLLITTTACALRAETRQASEVSPSSTTNGTLTPELVPMSAPVTSEPREYRRHPRFLRVQRGPPTMPTILEPLSTGCWIALSVGDEGRSVRRLVQRREAK